MKRKKGGYCMRFDIILSDNYLTKSNILIKSISWKDSQYLLSNSKLELYGRKKYGN